MPGSRLVKVCSFGLVYELFSVILACVSYRDIVRFHGLVMVYLVVRERERGREGGREGGRERGREREREGERGREGEKESNCLTW